MRGYLPCSVAVGYDPMLGRFTSPDSIVPDPVSVIGYNRFVYVNNNPMIYTDPSGHCYTTDENGNLTDNCKNRWAEYDLELFNDGYNLSSGSTIWYSIWQDSDSNLIFYAYGLDNGPKETHKYMVINNPKYVGDKLEEKKTLYDRADFALRFSGKVGQFIVDIIGFYVLGHEGASVDIQNWIASGYGQYPAVTSVSDGKGIDDMVIPKGNTSCQALGDAIEWVYVSDPDGEVSVEFFMSTNFGTHSPIGHESEHLFVYPVLQGHPVQVRNSGSGMQKTVFIVGMDEVEIVQWIAELDSK